MKDKRVLIMTGNVDIGMEMGNWKAPNNTFAELNLLTMPSKQRYAEKHGYDFLMIRNFGVDEMGMFPFSTTGYVYLGNMRVYRAFQMLNEYDVVMWLDGDSIVTNEELPIDHFQLDDQHSFYASYAWEWKQSFTTGNFIVQKTKHSKMLFDIYYKNANKFPHEMAAMNAIYNYNPNGVRDTMKILEHDYLESLPTLEMLQSIGVTWEGRPSIQWPWKEGNFMLHAGGLLNIDRIALLRKHFEKYI